MSVPVFRVRFLDLGYQPCPPDEQPARFGIECPNGKGWCDGMLIRTKEHAVHPSWEWNGNRKLATFRPSVDCRRCGWHGFVTDAEVEERP